MLNAGKGLQGPFIDMHDSEIEQIMQINANHVIYTAKIMIPQLVNRWKDKNIKSALLVTSTLGSHAPCSGFTLYCATKIFANYIV